MHTTLTAKLLLSTWCSPKVIHTHKSGTKSYVRLAETVLCHYHITESRPLVNLVSTVLDARIH